MKALVCASLILVVAIGVYFGAYFGLVERDGEWGPGGWYKDLKVFPRYRFGGDAAKNVFVLAHAIDFRIRPDFWSKEAFISDVVEQLRERARAMP